MRVINFNIKGAKGPGKKITKFRNARGIFWLHMVLTLA